MKKFLIIIFSLLFLYCDLTGEKDDSFNGFTVTVDNRSERIMEVFMNDEYQGTVNGESKMYIGGLDTGTYVFRAVTISSPNLGSTTHGIYDISSDITWTIYPL